MVDNLNSEISENLHNLVRLYEGATYFKNAADAQCNHTLLINSPRSFPNIQNSCNLRIFYRQLQIHFQKNIRKIVRYEDYKSVNNDPFHCTDHQYFSEQRKSKRSWSIRRQWVPFIDVELSHRIMKISKLKSVSEKNRSTYKKLIIFWTFNTGQGVAVDCSRSYCPSSLQQI